MFKQLTIRVLEALLLDGRKQRLLIARQVARVQLTIAFREGDGLQVGLRQGAAVDPAHAAARARSATHFWSVCKFFFFETKLEKNGAKGVSKDAEDACEVLVLIAN